LSPNGNANLVAGSWIDSVGGGRLDLSAALAPRAALGSWPSSGPADVALALEAAAVGARAWSELAPGRRRELLLAAVHALEEDTDALALTASRLGLTAEEMARHAGLGGALRGMIDSRVASGPGGVSVSVPAWSELFLGAFGGVAEELVRGNACVLVADPELPMVADAVARALLAVGVGEGVLSVLHGLTREGLAALVVDERVRALAVTGNRERISSLRHLVEGRQLEREALTLLRCGAAEIGPHDDLEARAVELVEAAFGRGRALFGQRPDQVARIFCPERQFSRFTEALLAALGESEVTDNPLPLIDRQAVADVQRQWAVGLDDGATLVFGGGIVGTAQDRCVMPTVLTNVDPGMACARRQEPMPILCLLRTHLAVP